MACDGSEKINGDMVIFMVFFGDMVIFVNGKDYTIYEMENKKCSKPPTSYVILWFKISKTYLRTPTV